MMPVIMLLQHSFGPAVARDNVAVESNGNAVGLHSQRPDQAASVKSASAAGSGKARTTPLMCGFMAGEISA